MSDALEDHIAIEDAPLFGSLFAPANLADYSLVLEQLGRGPVICEGWRGQSDISWRLDSAAFRRLKLDDDDQRRRDVVEDDLQEYELRLLDRARLAGHGHRNGRRLSDLELLGLLQHHGAATRLTDWTSNAFIALWFACRSYRDEIGVVFGANFDNAWRVTTEDMLGLTYPELLERAEGRVAYWHPAALSPRMPAQQAFFLWSEVQAREWSSLGTLPADEHGDVSLLSEEFTAIAVTPELKKEMRALWHKSLGYSEPTLFPDFDGFANTHGPTQAVPWDYFIDPR
jgi:FRG domain